MEFVVFSEIGFALLNELFKNEQIKITVQGALQDSATVATTTFIGGLTAGPGGAIAGAAVGTAILSASKALGYNDQYKPLPEVLNNLSAEGKRKLCEQLWESLKDSLTSKQLLIGTIGEMAKAIQQDPEMYETIKTWLSDWFTANMKEYSSFK